MTRLFQTLLLVVLFALGAAAVGTSGTSWHGTTSSATETGTVTVTSTVVVAPPQIITETVTGPAVTVTAPAPPAQVITITRTVVKKQVRKVRRYCTRQRKGWVCLPWPPG